MWGITLKKRRSKFLFIGLMLFIFLGGLFIGYNLHNTNFYCHIDVSELEDLYANLGFKTEFHELRFLNENMTLRQVKSLYQKTYPMSNGVLEWELTNLCD